MGWRSKLTLLLQLIFTDLPVLLTTPAAEAFAEKDDEPHDEGQASKDQASLSDGLIVIVEGVHIALGAATLQDCCWPEVLTEGSFVLPSDWVPRRHDAPCSPFPWLRPQ